MRIITNDAEKIGKHRKLFKRFFSELSARVYFSPSVAIIHAFEEAAGKAEASWTVIKIGKKIPGGVKIEKRGGPREKALRPLSGVEKRQIDT